MLFEHDVHCCIVCAIVQVFGQDSWVRLQLYADNRKWVSIDPDQLLRVARITTGYNRLLWHQPTPTKSVIMSTSLVVFKDMLDWFIFDDGVLWSVKLYVRDLGGDLDTTFRAWDVTLAASAPGVLRDVWMVAPLPPSYRGKSSVLRTKFNSAALHGIEASILSQSTCLRFRAVWCRWRSLFWGVWNGVVLGKGQREKVPCRFCGGLDGDFTIL